MARTSYFSAAPNYQDTRHNSQFYCDQIKPINGEAINSLSRQSRCF